MQKYLNKPIFNEISSIADEHDKEAYVIGGYVRDSLLNRPTNDVDILVIGSGIELAKAVAKKLGGLKVSVFKNFGTAMFRHQGLDIEFVGARKESYHSDSRKPIVEDGTLEDDQNRRDFTINAMAFSLNKANYGQLIDPFEGEADLKARIIRTPLEPLITFSDDPLRILRAIRFATQLNFQIEESTYQGIIANKERLSIISMERVTEELNKMILSNRPSVGFKLLEKTGILPLILPELQAMKGIETVKGRAHKDNFYHTLQVLDRITPYSDDLWLRWSALLHDIAKPKTKRFDPQQGWTFHAHNYVGSKMIPHIFKKLRLPLNEKMKFVQKMVALHMRPIVLSEEDVTDSAVRRLLFEAGDDIDSLMTLCEADITSKNEVKVRKYLRNFKIVRQKLKEIEEKDRLRNFQPPVSGEEIMQTFGLPACRTVGEIKNAIKDAILDGLIHNEYEEAHRYMLKLGKEMGLTQV